MQKLNTPEKFDHYFQEISEQYSEKIDSYKEIIQVCIGGGCIACGSINVKKELEKKLLEKNLGNKFMVKGTGCLGPCSKGSAILMKKADIFYENLQIADIDELIESHLVNELPVERLLHHSDEDGTAIPQVSKIKFTSHKI